MAEHDQEVNQQYGRSNLAEQIISALRGAGKDVDNLTRADLSTFDEFHIGGVAETRTLAGKIPNFGASSKVLDIGSGLGGPARTLADEFGCEVVGLDLTEEYYQAAVKLTDLVGMSDNITYKHGNALDMPFDDNSFDVVWTQFAGMNIEDKQRLYSQIHRVLRPNGYFAFHEVFEGNGNDLVFPVFWADDDRVNFLQSNESIQAILADVGFKQVIHDDLTQYSYEWFEKMIAKRAEKAQEPQPLGFNVFVGEETPLKAKNIIENLRLGLITVYQGVYQAIK